MRYTSKEQLIIEFKKLLLDKQLSQREIAHKLNITPQALTKIINKQNFSFDDMEKLLSAVNYGMDIQFIPAASNIKEAEPPNESSGTAPDPEAPFHETLDQKLERLRKEHSTQAPAGSNE